MLSYLSHLKPNTLFQNNNTPLQAHKRGNSEKDKRVYLKASLTVEAALGLPLILFAMVVLLMPVRIMNADMRMQAAAEAVVIDASKYQYTVKELKKYENENATSNAAAEEEHNSNAEECKSITSDAALGAYAALRAVKEVDDERLNIISFTGSRFMREDDMIVVRLDYEYQLPFPVLHLGSITQEAVASRRAWTGKDGSDGATGISESEDDEIVYIGKNPTRYHLSPTCHYLSNNYNTVTVGSDGRASGRKPCDRCGEGAATGQTVYVTPEGDKFHTDKNCSSMRSYPQAVKRSEVEYLGCCSYCERKK